MKELGSPWKLLGYRALWQKMNSWVYAGFDETYKMMGVSFDNETEVILWCLARTMEQNACISDEVGNEAEHTDDVNARPDARSPAANI